MIEVRIKNDGVIIIETLIRKVEGNPCGSATKYCLHFVREAHVATKFIVEGIEKALYFQIESSFPTEAELAVTGIILIDVTNNRLIQWKDQPVKLLVVLHVGDDNEESKYKKKSVEKLHVLF